MTKQSDGSNAGDPTATGVIDGDPGRATDGEGTPPPDGTPDSAIQIPEDGRESILSHFTDTVSDDDPDTGEGDGGGGGDPDDGDMVDLAPAGDTDGDQVDDEGGNPDETDLAGDDGDQDDYREGFADEDLDAIAERLSKEDQGKAFAYLRKKAKEADKLQDAAELGVRFNNLIERSGLDQEGIADLVATLGSVKADPLKAVTLLRSQLAKAVSNAKARYKGVEIEKVLDFDVEGLASDDGETELPDDLAERVDAGEITEELAVELAQLREGTGGGDDSQDKGQPTEYPQDVVDTYSELARDEMKALGFYQVPANLSQERRQELLDDRIDKHLIPEVSRLAIEEGIDPNTCHPRERRDLMVRATKNVMAKIRKQQGKRQGKPLRRSDGQRPAERPKGAPKNEDELRQRVRSHFS